MRRLLTHGIVIVVALLLVAAPAVAQDPTVTLETTPAETPLPTETTPPIETTLPADTTAIVDETVTETETETETAEPSRRVDLESWHWALVAAGATAVVLIAFAVGRGSRRQQREPTEKTQAARNQMLLAALSGWLAEGWVIESQSSTEAVVRKGTERRLLTVDAHGSLNRSELPAVAPDPTWVAPGDDASAPADE